MRVGVGKFRLKVWGRGRGEAEYRICRIRVERID